MKCGDRVSVSPRFAPEECIYGVVDFIDWAPVNRGMKNGPFTNYIYIALDVPDYPLLRGSPIRVRNQGLCIVEAVSSAGTVDVFCDDGGYNCCKHVFTIPQSDIQSMLFSEQAFEFSTVS
jgi:hypothetical protein